MMMRRLRPSERAGSRKVAIRRQTRTPRPTDADGDRSVGCYCVNFYCTICYSFNFYSSDSSLPTFQYNTSDRCTSRGEAGTNITWDFNLYGFGMDLKLYLVSQTSQILISNMNDTQSHGVLTASFLHTSTISISGSIMLGHDACSLPRQYRTVRYSRPKASHQSKV